jgi:hypothetical protein
MRNMDWCEYSAVGFLMERWHEGLCVVLGDVVGPAAAGCELYRLDARPPVLTGLCMKRAASSSSA